jgi:hypothetical protein
MSCALSPTRHPLHHLPTKIRTFCRKNSPADLENGQVCFDLCLQRFVDAKVTPIEDTAVEWTEMALAAHQGRHSRHQASLSPARQKRWLLRI